MTASVSQAAALLEGLDSAKRARDLLGKTLDEDFGFWSSPTHAKQRLAVFGAYTLLDVAAAERVALLRRIEELEADCRSIVNLAVKTKIGTEVIEEWREHVRLLLPLAKGYVAAHPGIDSTREIVAEADKALHSEEQPYV